MKVKEWCIALDNVSPYIDSILGSRYKFLKGERATKEKVFGMIPSMTEEEYARYFRPATEEEINGEFEWDGEQYVLKSQESMKSIKEKAEAYDIALDKIKRLLGTGSNCSREDLEYVFPELKESEDEKMRKELISLVKKTKVTDRYYDLNKMLAWLEKQGEQILANSTKTCKIEQKPTQEIEPTPIFRIGNILKRKGKDYTFIVDRIQGGYYHCDHNNGAFFPIEEQDKWELVEQKSADKVDQYSLPVSDNSSLPTFDESIYHPCTEKVHEQKPADKVEPKFKVGDEIKTKNEESFIITRIDRWGYWSEDLFICNFDDADNWELVEQKPAWSEEDEKNMETLINVLYAGTDLAYEREINWLKSLKDRVQSKPKQGEQKLLNNEEYQTIPVETLDRLYATEKELEKLKQVEQNPIVCNNSATIDSNLNRYCCKQFNKLYKENGGVLSFARLQNLAIDIYEWCRKQNQNEQNSELC